MFLYQNNKYKMKIKNINTINEAFKKFLSLIDKKEEDLLLLYKGKKIEIKNKKLKYEINNNITILVINIQINSNINNNDYIRCPKCNNLSFLNINKNSYNISLNNCVKNHQLNDLSIDEFIKEQNNDNINCDICHNNKNLYNDNFYICSCGKYICKLCLEKHNNKNHNLIEYCKRHIACKNHKKENVSYCKDCKMNLCKKCEEEHNKHKIVFYKMIMPNRMKKNELKDNLKDNIERIKEYKEEINIINEMNNNCIINLNNDLDGFMNIINRMINNLDMLTNYETIYNVINFKLEMLNKDISNFLSENLKNKKLYLMNILDRYIHQMDIIYEKEKDEDEIKLFGAKFVENNSKKSFIKIDNKIYKMREKFNINDKKIKSIKNIKVRLYIDIKVHDISYMFDECEKLSSITDISKWKSNSITNMKSMFRKCEKLSSLPDISKWVTSKVTNLSSMFDRCKSLSSLPDISKWNTINVNDMSAMFLRCEKLSSLPDISKWNTINVTNMNSMFAYCSSLSSLSDISKWNTSKVINLNHMFWGCKSLSSLPDFYQKRNKNK